MKLALIHDDFCQLGGAERLFAEIAKIYPKAPIYTSLVDWSKIPKSINKDRIHTSFIQKLPFAQKFYKALLPLYPLAFESFDFSQFDLVISSTTRFAKSIITSPQTIHVCYINSTPRFLYNQNQADQYLPPSLRFILKPYLGWLKKWDKVSSNRVDLYIANSKNVQKSVHDEYNCQSVVVHPFADIEFFREKREKVRELGSDSYFLIVSRLVKWKNIEIAIRATQEIGINLKIVGKGSDEARLKKLGAGVQGPESSIEFLGQVTKEKLRDLYQNAKALIVTQEEDFGIAMIEAQSCGIPVIAYRAGGALEIIKEGKTGIFFKKQSAESLKDAIVTLSRLKCDISLIRKNALRFTRSRFRKELEATITSYAGHN